MIESKGKPLVVMVRYDYLVNLLEALEAALDSKFLKQAVAGNDEFFSFEDVMADHNNAHNVEVRLEDIAKV